MLMRKAHVHSFLKHRLRRNAENALHYNLRFLPAQIQLRIQPITFFLLDKPDLTLYQDLEPETLGLFEGFSLLEGSPCMPEEHPKITLFYMNIWAYSGCRLHLYHKEIRTTLYHEIGHYLGWDESDLFDKGLD